jgi:hypothetical protein
VRQTPNNKSNQPISSLFRDHMEIPLALPNIAGEGRLQI